MDTSEHMVVFYAVSIVLGSGYFPWRSVNCICSLLRVNIVAVPGKTLWRRKGAVLITTVHGNKTFRQLFREGGKSCDENKSDKLKIKSLKYFTLKI